MMYVRMSLSWYICVLLLVLVVLTYGRPRNTRYLGREHLLLRERLLQHHNLLPRLLPRQQHYHPYHTPRRTSDTSQLTRTERGRSRSRRAHVSLPSRPRGAVTWGARCSPKRAKVRPNSDVSLECEVLVPDGSVLLWKKDGMPVHFIQEYPGDVLSNSIRPSLYMDQYVGSHGTVHMSTRVYIDCANEEHEGLYTLEVHTPNGKQSKRNFTVTLAESAGHSVGMFCYDLAIVPYIPRIYEYARAHGAIIGQEIILPCKVQGNNHTVSWYFQNRQLPQNSPSFQIHANGNLLIRELNLDHRGVFSCQTMSTIVPELTDIAFTTVYPVLPQEEETNEINQSLENLSA
ncbi:unnamed protein product [Meganyctiphanes norvegica]|uniref:Ig-like domain-containing protein n=1 Tax=Meganyctiphanes norvegica TaxID=48144 RepID=A0AAV2QEF2_MEGNR